MPYEAGELVRKDPERADAMAFYVFRNWVDTPAHVRGGRIARVTWCYNGTEASSWEADLCPAGRSVDDVAALIDELKVVNRHTCIPAVLS